MQARLALATIGIGIWGYGYAVESADFRLVGIILLALSLLLRFAPGQRRRPPDDTGAAG
jgi:hypothetical protein